jgi:hypothetical protein
VITPSLYSTMYVPCTPSATVVGRRIFMHACMSSSSWGDRFCQQQPEGDMEKKLALGPKTVRVVCAPFVATFLMKRARRG